MDEYLPTIEVLTTAQPQFTVIWLHGLGADGHDFEPIVPELGLPPDLGIRFIFPHAPMQAVTCNNGYVMRAWYDIMRIDGLDRQVDEAGILASSNAIRHLISRENRRGVISDRIVLAGFSQGGAMAYSAGLTYPEKLAGIIALSAYLPAPSLLAPESLIANRHTPIFAGHGTEDDVVPLQLGLQASKQLQEQGYMLEWQTYPIPHSVCQEEIADIGRWLQARFTAIQQS